MTLRDAPSRTIRARTPGGAGQVVEKNGKRQDATRDSRCAVHESDVRVPRYSPDGNTWIFVTQTSTRRSGALRANVADPPTAIVADARVPLNILTDFPEILRNIRMVYMENDGGREVLAGVRNILTSHGLVQRVNTSHHKLFVRQRARTSRRRRSRSPSR